MFDGETLPTLDASRVRLRWLTAADAPALYDIFSHPDVARYWSTPAYTELRQAEELVDEIHDFFAAGTLFQWGVAERGTDRVIGTTTLWQIDAGNQRAEIGFALARDRWGQGYMLEALRTFLGWCFDELDLRRIEADVDPGNAGSLRLLERLGFQREGYLRERWNTGGTIQDSVFLGLLARELDRG